MFVVYVLYSINSDKLYIGFTSNLIARFKSHNCLGNEWTKRYRPWMVGHVEFFDTKKQAMAREKKLKGGQGRYFIRNNFINDL
jgi:putative endonuclease